MRYRTSTRNHSRRQPVSSLTLASFVFGKYLIPRLFKSLSTCLPNYATAAGTGCGSGVKSESQPFSLLAETSLLEAKPARRKLEDTLLEVVISLLRSCRR